MTKLNDQRRVDDDGLQASDVNLVTRSLVALGRACRYRLLRRLSGGVSGAQVLLLEMEHERAVLKVTEVRGWRERALRELSVYSELAPVLGVALPTVTCFAQRRWGRPNPHGGTSALAAGAGS
jgi:hypothetical protein